MRYLVAAPLLTGCGLLFPLDEAPTTLDAATDSAADAATDSPIQVDATVACPARFDLQFNGSKYEVVDVFAATWAEAKTHCEFGAETIAHLAVPDDRIELDFLKSRLQGVAWVGVARLSTASGVDKLSFLEITGEVAAIELWRADEPSNSNGTEYAVGISNGNDFTDFEPTLNHPFICECDLKPPITYDW